MNKGKKMILLAAALIALPAAAGVLRLEPNATVSVQEDHQSVTVLIENQTENDLFCDTITLDIVRVGREYGDFASHAHVHSGPVYIPAGANLDLSALGSPANLANQGVQGVSSADVDTRLCHPASFGEYCAYAEKTAEERHTTDLILRTARRECQDAEGVISRGLNLDKNNIRSVKPIGFLRNLRGLSLERNMIEDLSPLRSLSFLTELDISDNPVSDLSPVMNLISIRAIDANHTRVEANPDPIAHLHRRGVRVNLRGTPASRKK